jgi:DNA polymerase elongation subunit (family B)
MCSLKRLDNGKRVVFEQYEGHPLDRRTLHHVLKNSKIITFNGINYDMPMIGLALQGVSCETLKRCSDFIIQGNMRPWDAEREFQFRIPVYDHIDVIEVVPTMVSLKVFMGRLHCPKMQDLPIEHDATITPEQRPAIVEYNENDLDGTIALYQKFVKQIELREKMSAEYGIDLRSKSDAQVAEAVMKSKLTAAGVVVTKPGAKSRTFKFRFPRFLEHAGPIVQEVIQRVRESDFIVDSGGYVKMPKQLSEARIRIGRGVYRLGIGGLHSSEKSVCHRADAHTLLIDRDVASYYPAIMINTGLFPKHLGQVFMQVFREIRDTRIAAKKGGLKTIAETLKIVLNGLFGKFGNPWSIVYAPDLMIQVTITGQLALLMLIEWIEQQGIPVVSANTDGIVIKCPRSMYDLLELIIKRWEEVTGFETEETRYTLLASRDVNSYIALKEGGGVKLKGTYAEPEPVASSWPSPHNQICITAACDLLEHGVPLDLTIKSCNDMRQFVEVRNVTGGATWRGEYLGRAVRWYKAVGGEPIYYKKEKRPSKKNPTGGGYNKVPSTDGCKPLMRMDGSIPADLDFDAYVREAEGILEDIGVTLVT